MRTPDDDRQLFSVGVTHKYEDWTLEAAFMYVDVDTRTVNSATNYVSGDANGTDAYNGIYSTDVSLISVGFTKPF